MLCLFMMLGEDVCLDESPPLSFPPPFPFSTQAHTQNAEGRVCEAGKSGGRIATDTSASSITYAPVSPYEQNCMLQCLGRCRLAYQKQAMMLTAGPVL